MTAAGPVPPEGSSTLELHGDRATLEFRRFLRHPPAKVWAAITEPDAMAEWHLTSGRIEGRVGGVIELTTRPSNVRSTGRVTAWDPPRLFEYEWSIPATDAWPAGESATVRWELRPESGGTLVILTQRGLTERAARVFQHGMRGFLDRLGALLDGRPLPDWQERVRELRAAPSDPRTGGPT